MRALLANWNEWTGMGRKLLLPLAAAMTVLWLAAGHAAETLVFRIELKDGAITPLRLEVPAGRRIKFELHNTGDTPAEFESDDLRKEKVLAPHSSSFLIIRRTHPGEYKFIDEFHLKSPPMMLVVK